jgi:CHASE3 domain sensor protein
VLRDYKKEIDLLRQEISLMENHLSTQNDENVKVLNPYIISNFQELSNQISLQLKDNDHLQKQLIELKRDKSTVQQAIIHCQHKISALEGVVGC